MALLRRFEWPGNIREFENAIEHAFVLCSGDVIEIEHLPNRFVASTRNEAKKGQPFGQSSPEVVIREAIARQAGDRTKAARELGMHRTTLWRKMRQYGIEARANKGRRAPAALRPFKDPNLSETDFFGPSILEQFHDIRISRAFGLPERRPSQRILRVDVSARFR